MGFELGIFDGRLEPEFLEWLVDVHGAGIREHFARLWDYYANPMVPLGGPAQRKVSESGRGYMQAQEAGLPARITGLARGPHAGADGVRPLADIQRKEVVIENDIAWRVNAAADFLFGKPLRLISRAADGRRRSDIEAILHAVFAANGGLGFFQDMAVLGSVYGFVDCYLRPGAPLVGPAVSTPSTGVSHASVGGGGPMPSSPDRNSEIRASGSRSDSPPLSSVLQWAQAIDLELIEAPRALPVLDEDDYRVIRYYVQHFQQRKNAVGRRGSFLSRLLGGPRADHRQVVAVTEITSPEHWQRYEDQDLVAEGDLPWGFLPVVHIQNVPQPYYYEGVSDVEPLIPLQDELNTRLSDRASRITFQSFKMYLGKGIEGFQNQPVAPGRMWHTDNPEASIQEFGGDAAAPSEDLHIAEIREALDKTSGVTPIVAGLLKDRLGNLSSAVALRMVFMGMLARNERKRHAYGEGLQKICRMILSLLDTAGVYPTDDAEREVEIVFPSPLPEDTLEKLQEAQLKKELGVPAEQVLKELGYQTQGQM